MLVGLGIGMAPIENFQASLGKLYGSLTDQQIKEVNRKTVEAVAEQLHSLVDRHSTSAALFCLDTALHFFKSAIIDKRLAGLAWIIDIANYVKTRGKKDAH